MFYKELASLGLFTGQAATLRAAAPPHGGTAPLRFAPAPRPPYGSRVVIKNSNAKIPPARPWG